MTNDYTFGVEEEFFLVDIETKTASMAMSEAFFEAVKAELGTQVMGEMLQSQIEVATVPHTDTARAAAELKYLRQTVGAIAAKHGLAILASGTHPTAEWGMSQQTQKVRYDAVMHDLGMLGRRNMLCGLHVHVELPDPDDRVDVMYRMLPYLPLFVALSTSSPFWQSHRTGLKGYRLAAYNELPRTGVPELFRTREEFDAYVQALVRSGVIEDSSYIWWAIRPSLGNPTLELRAPDCCTLVEDSIAIAALYRSLARRLTNSPWINADMTPVMRALVVENKWRAQRYGVHGTFVNETGTGAITVAEMLNQVVEDVTPDAEALGCLAEVRRCCAIVGAGTSADAQLAIFDAHIFDAHEDSRRYAGALNAVTDWIATATLGQS